MDIIRGTFPFFFFFERNLDTTHPFIDVALLSETGNVHNVLMVRLPCHHMVLEANILL